ncbi:MAG: peptidoglycan binding domain-containing protein [Thermomicrobiales bacterium]|nr:peptidoglycan binding domain-containing protein [Thermomicrobiales bacterium]
MAATAMVITAIVSLLIILAGASLLVYGRVQRGESVFDGVSAAGVNLGGKSKADAVALLSERFDEFSTTEIAFNVGDTSFTATPAELGATFNAQATADNAYDFGRRQSLWQESRNWLDSIVGGHEVAPVVQLDKETFAQLMDGRARSAAIPPRQAAFVQNNDGSVSIDPGASGVAVNVEETYRRVVDRLVTMSDRPVSIATTEIPQSVESAQLKAALTEAQTLRWSAADA